MVVNAPCILRLRAKFQMVWVAARAITAQMVKREPFGNWPETLRPIPAVCHVQLAVAMDAPVPVLAMNREDPTACVPVDLVRRCGTPAVAGVVHLRLPGDVPEPRKLSDGRLFAAPAEANTIPSDLFSSALVMPLQEAGVASGHRLRDRVCAVGNTYGFATTATAFARWVRAARVIWFDRVTAGGPLFPVPNSIPQEFSGNLKRSPVFLGALGLLAAPTHTETRRVGRRCTLNTLRLKSGAVPVDESAAARQAAVGALYELAAPAFAKLAKIDLGHLISLQDLWSWLAGVLALGQPFQCNRCTVVKG